MSGYLANLLGAVSLGVSDRVTEIAEESAGLGGEAASALVLIGMAPRVTIKLLAERLRLSHPGTVRLADRLEAAGLIRRERSEDRRLEDRREVRLAMTRKGHALHERLRGARQDALEEIVSALSAQQKAALEPVLAKLVETMASDHIEAWNNCRLCDAKTCAARGCPVAAWDQPDET
jgi:MarR family transcriptional regulator, negative regulator of the multidrug operon emrRAB